MRIEARFGNPHLIEPFVWNVIEYVMPLALSRLPRAIDHDRVVLFGHRQSRVARVAGQIFSPGVDDEAVGVWVGVPRRKMPIRKSLERVFRVMAFRRAAFEGERDGSGRPIAAPEDD